MIKFKHKHAYVYAFELQKRSPYVGWEKMQYVLLTDHDNPNSKTNRQLLETGLRIAYGHMPKSVKFLYDKFS